MLKSTLQPTSNFPKRKTTTPPEIQDIKGSWAKLFKKAESHARHLCSKVRSLCPLLALDGVVGSGGSQGGGPSPRLPPHPFGQAGL